MLLFISDLVTVRGNCGHTRAGFATNRNPPNRNGRGCAEIATGFRCFGQRFVQSSRATDWRRPTQCLLTLRTRRRANRPPLQSKQAVCAPTFNRPDRVAGGSQRTGCNERVAVTAVGSLVSLCAVSTDTRLVGANRVAQLGCTDRCTKQQQPVAISLQPRPFLLPGFHNQIHFFLDGKKFWG